MSDLIKQLNKKEQLFKQRYFKSSLITKPKQLLLVLPLQKNIEAIKLKWVGLEQEKDPKEHAKKMRVKINHTFSCKTRGGSKISDIPTLPTSSMYESFSA